MLSGSKIKKTSSTDKKESGIELKGSSCNDDEQTLLAKTYTKPSIDSEFGLSTVMNKIAKTVKTTTGANIKFFPSSIAKLWVIFYYTKETDVRLNLLNDPIIKDALKLRSVDGKNLTLLSSRFYGTSKNKITLSTKGFEKLEKNFLKCPPASSLIPSFSLDIILKTFGEFFTDFVDLFIDRSSVFTSKIIGTPHETNTSTKRDLDRVENSDVELCSLWEKLVFLLKLYKTPAGSFEDIVLWKKTYTQKFIEAKKTMLSKHPVIPFDVISFVVYLMGDH